MLLVLSFCLFLSPLAILVAVILYQIKGEVGTKGDLATTVPKVAEVVVGKEGGVEEEEEDSLSCLLARTFSLAIVLR